MANKISSMEKKKKKKKPIWKQAGEAYPPNKVKK